MKALALCVIALALGCDSYRIDPEDFRRVPRPPPAGYAQVRFFNALTAYPPDIYLRDVQSSLAENIGFGKAQGYFELAAQPYALDVRPGGTSDRNAPVYSETVELTERTRSTLFYVSPPKFYALSGDLQRVDPGLLKVFNASASAVSIDFGSDGSYEVSGLAQFADARATLPTVLETRLTVMADADVILESAVLPERPDIGDVVIVVMPDYGVKLLTYSFVVEDL